MAHVPDRHAHFAKMPSRGFSALLHIISLASFYRNWRCLLDVPNPIIDKSYGWQFQFLTIIGLTLSTITFSIGLLSDITKSASLLALKTHLSVAAAPLELLITLLYWGIKYISTDLVLPEWAPPIELSIDLGLHFVPVLVLMIDVLVFSPPWAITVLPSAGINSCIAILYWFWIEECQRQNGFYPYPILEEAGFSGRLALFSTCIALMTLTVWVVKRLYAAIHGVNLPHTFQSSKKLQ